ncbi:NAD(P)/FAD-dependent oxidoreductase [Thomasclavelia sp.]
MKTTVIIGAGASGLLCGHELAKSDINVIILEQSNKSGRKILASGNGRCNLSNTNMDMYYYNTNDPRIERIVCSFDAKNYFNLIGVLTKQVGTLLYPRSNQSLTVKNALMKNFDRVSLIEECQAVKIIKKNKGYLVKSNRGDYQCDNVVIATGSPASLLSGENSYDLVKDLDLKVTKLYPSLVQVKTKPAYPKLKGVRVKCCASLYIEDKLIESQSGEVLFSEQGLSGICIMQLSRLLPEKNEKAEISLDLLEEYSDSEVINLLNERLKIYGDYYLEGIFNDKLAKVLVNVNLKDLRFRVLGTYDYSKAQVMRGGVSLEEVNENLECLRYPGIYIAGEVLDVDGDCGGYNLHFAFASGYHIAKTILNKQGKKDD